MIATLGTKCKKGRGRTFVVGKRGAMTVRAIATEAGISKDAVWQRIHSGWKGEDLLMPAQQTKRGVKQPARKPSLVLAVKLVRKFPDRVPTPEEVMKVRPMCRRNALRWCQVLSEGMEAA